MRVPSFPSPRRVSGPRARPKRRWLAAAVLVPLLTVSMAVGIGLPAAAQTNDPSPTDSASPSPTDSPSPSPTDSPSPSDTPSPDPSPTATPTPTPSASGGANVETHTKVNGKDIASALPSPGVRGQGARKRGGGASERSGAPAGHPSSIAGTYSTASLDAAAARLRRQGVSEDRVLERVYPPFIVEGPAAWTNTWHAPRYAGGFHLHEGQDVFCRYGAPVLAAVDGVVQFDTDTLGGNIARLFNPDGSYWYYAHLSGWNTKIQSGSTVHVGDVIGYCGNTGDAVNSPTHVHFGHYLASGEAVNPMRQLIAWLGAAEDRLPKNLRTPRPSPTTLPNDSGELGVASPALPNGTPSLEPASAPLQPVLRRAPTSTTGDPLIVALAIMIPMMLGALRRRPAGLGAHAVTRR